MVVAFLMRSPFYRERGINTQSGNYNGYVAFKEELPLSYQGEWNSNTEVEEHLDDIVEVHGGITLDSKGFSESLPIIPITEIPEDFRSYRVIGFDCCHLGDTSENWTFEATKEETLNLKKQIEELIKEAYPSEPSISEAKALEIAKEYGVEEDFKECISNGLSPEDALKECEVL